MKAEVLLKAALMVLVVALAAVITSWLSSEGAVARAQGGGGGSASGKWILVTSTIQTGESVLYMFNAEKEVLLVYAYYRRSGTTRGTTRYRGDLEFLAGRHCKWDALYSQQRPYPYGINNSQPPSGSRMPAEIKKHLVKITEN